MRVKNHLFLLVILILGGRLLATDTTGVCCQITEISEKIRQQYCPDRRTSVWKVEPQWVDDRYVLTGETDRGDARADFYKQIDAIDTGVEFEKRIQLLPDDVMDGIVFAVPKNSIATLRRRPSVAEEMVTQSLRGLPLEILKKERGFYLVRTDDGYLGWVGTDRVQEGGLNFKEEWLNAPQVVYVDIEGVVYSRRSKKSQPVSDVVMGNRFRLLDRKWRWTKVAYPDGREGYLPTKSLEKLEDYLNRPLDRAELVKTAKLLMGRPYMWGAASPKQLDCSGFTQTVFRQHGYVLQRDASMQVHEGVAVDTTDFPERLQSGDLIFFGPGPTRITHVALYIGNYEFIHSSGRVRLDSFNPADPHYNNYRRTHIRAVRRVTK